MINLVSKKSKLLDSWHILEMDQWDEDHINMEVQAYIRIDRNGLVSGQVCGRFEKGPKFDFTWDGVDENDDVCGDGWIIARDTGTGDGEFRIHTGDSSLFRARRVTQT